MIGDGHKLEFDTKTANWRLWCWKRNLRGDGHWVATVRTMPELTVENYLDMMQGNNMEPSMEVVRQIRQRLVEADTN